MFTSAAVPNWLDKQFIEQAIREGERKEVKVNRIEVRAATSAGDNYTSDIYRVLVECDTQNGRNLECCSKSLIVKSVSVDENLRKIMTANDAFTSEIEILRNVVPAMHHLLDMSPCAKPVVLGPRCYMFTGKPYQKLVMEDLCQSGFRMVPKLLGLDLEHSKLAVSHLGILHAVSVALYSQKPHMFDNFRTHVYFRMTEGIAHFLKQSLSAVAEKVHHTWPEERRRYSEKVRHLVGTALQRLENAIHRDEKGFNVLIHGDAWTNNMMFRYGQDGKLSDMTFVDFQCSYYGSPALDLQYFLHTSPTPQVRSHQLEDLLNCYHSSLSNTLTSLGCGCQCPSLDDIRIEMKKRVFFGIYAFFCIKPLASARPEITPDLGKLCDASFQTASYAHLTDDYNKELETFLPILEKEGLFD